jgi:pyridoxal phosphate enzyme (YggS family)
MNNRSAIIQENIETIRKKIAQAAAKSGRSGKAIQLAAVTKNVAIEDIRTAIQAGIKIVGENKVQEARQKFFQIGPAVAWHMIGHLQTNKARHAAAIFDMVQSVDTSRVAEALDQECGKLDRQMDVLVEVNISADTGKFGTTLAAAEALVHFIESKTNLRLRGLMAMAPVVPDPELTRPFFSRMQRLFKQLQDSLARPEWNVLSMGMTHDFEVAIEEGSNLVRIGTGIFHTPDLRRLVE